MPTPPGEQLSARGARTDHTSQLLVPRRLDKDGQRVNAAVARLRDATDDVKGRMGRRVDSLRAQEAEFWTRLRELRDTDRTASIAELDQALGQFETQIDIAEAQLDAELSTDAETFAAAVAAELEAWDVRLNTLAAAAADFSNGARRRVDAVIDLLRQPLAEADRQLEQLKAAGSEASATLRAGVRQAMDDLDWTAEEAISNLDIARRSP